MLTEIILPVDACEQILKPNKHNSKKLKKNYLKLSGASSVAIKFFAFGYFYLMAKTTLSEWGDVSVGFFATIFSLSQTATFLDFGIGYGVQNEVGKLYANKNKNETIKLIKNSLFVLVVVQTTIWIYVFSDVVFGFDLLKNYVYGGLEGDQLEILALGFVLSAVCCTSALPKIGIGMLKMFSVNIVLISGYCISFALYITLAQFGASFICSVTVALIVLATSNVACLLVDAQIIISIKNFFSERISERVVKKVLSDGGVWTWFQIVAFAGVYVDPIVILNVYGSQDAATYNLLMKIQAALLLSQFAAIPLWPAFVHGIELENWSWVNKTFQKLNFLSILCGLISFLVIALMSNWLISKLFGDVFMPATISVAGMALWGLVNNYLSGVNSLLSSPSTLKHQVLLLTIAASVSVILKIVIIVTGLSADYFIFAAVIGYSMLSFNLYKCACTFSKGKYAT